MDEKSRAEVTLGIINENNLQSMPQLVPSPESRQTALSFDDGPHIKHTTRLLDLAKAYQAKFTFFVVGQQAVNQKSLLMRMRDEGHEIGNHSWNHPDFKSSPEDLIQKEVNRCHILIREVTGEAPKLFRPPYGSINEQQRAWIENRYGYRTAFWNVDSMDWHYRDCKKIHERLLDYKMNNSVILLHDIYGSSIDATEMTLKRLAQQKFTCVTISQLRLSLGVL